MQVFVLDLETQRLRQLTYFSAPCRILGWAPDKRIVVSSATRSPFRQCPRTWFIDLESGQIESAPFGPLISFAAGPTGTLVMNVAAVDARTWQAYEGGAQGEIRLRQPNGEEQVIRSRQGNVSRPLICGERIYFVMTVAAQTNLFSCDFQGSSIRAETSHSEFAVHSPATDGRRIVYCMGSDLFLLDPPQAPVRIPATLPDATSHPRQTKVLAAEGLVDIDASRENAALALSAYGTVFEYRIKRRRWTRCALPAYCSHLKYLSNNRLVAVLPHDDGDQFAILEANREEHRLIKPAEDLGIVLEIAVAPAALLALVANDRHELFSVNLRTGETVLLDRSLYGRISQIVIDESEQFAAYTFPVASKRTILRVSRTSQPNVIAETDPRLADFSPRFMGKSIAFLSASDEFEPDAALRTTVKLWNFSDPDPSSSVRTLPMQSESSAGIIPLNSGIAAISRALEPTLKLISTNPLRWRARGERMIKFGKNGLLIQAASRVLIFRTHATKTPAIVLDLDLNELRFEIDKTQVWQHALDYTCRLVTRHVPLTSLAHSDWNELRRRYRQLLTRAMNIHDVLAVLNELLGHLRTSHAFVRREMSAAADGAGFLGVDTEFDSRRAALKIRRIPRVHGHWSLRRGLADPAAGARVDDWITAIGSRKLTTIETITKVLAGKAGQTVRCRLRSKNGMTRETEFEALGEERSLFYASWITERERLVAELSDRSLGFLHLADTSAKTRTQVERWLSCHDELSGIILDVRYNEGGSYWSEIAELLLSKSLAVVRSRWTTEQALPAGLGKSVVAVLTNRFTSSGGELIAELLRHYAGARIVGERTFGGAVGHTVSRRLPDALSLWLPELVIELPAELAAIENRGVRPDIVVPWEAEWTSGSDGFVVAAIQQMSRKEHAC